MSNTTFEPTASSLAIGTYYIATNYGLEKETAENTANIDNIANSNTEKLQKLVDQVSANGGGTIFFPVGTYCFGIKEEDLPNLPTAEHPYALYMPSNVSIVGENTENTIFKLIDINEEVTLKVNGEETAVTQHYPYTLFYFMGDKDHPITGCSYTNFTVDAFATDKKWMKEPKESEESEESEESDNYVKGNMYYAKAFYYQYVKDCVFRDLILKGTLGTALGIDYLDNVQIENVNCYQCGRNFYDDTTATGSSGIGIGTGGWENENFYIHNCTCVESGQYGIFIENQTRFGWGGNEYFSKGCIISNCITRNGHYRGLGIRGGQYVTVISCESYENLFDGIFIDGECKNVKINNCSFADNQGNGIYLETSAESGTGTDKLVISNNMIESNKLAGISLRPLGFITSIIIKDNQVISNELIGIRITKGFTSAILINNYVSNSPIALSFDCGIYPKCIVKDNIFLGTIENAGEFESSFNKYNEVLITHSKYKPILYTEFEQDEKLNSLGVVEKSGNSMRSRYIDISDIPNNQFYISFSQDIDAYRLVQYRSQNESEESVIFPNSSEKIIPMNNPRPEGKKLCYHTVSATKLNEAKYIRIFIPSDYCPLSNDFRMVIFY